MKHPLILQIDILFKHCKENKTQNTSPHRYIHLDKICTYILGIKFDIILKIFEQMEFILQNDYTRSKYI